jgi:uncharacterized secreted protein with C-terminal beta-propeller domain
MKRIVCIVFLLVTMGTASVSVKMEKGWQFIGFPADIAQMHYFDTPQVEVVWGFDGRTQQWLGYSPDKETMEKIGQRYAPLKEIDAGQGVWIYNTEPWVLSLEEESRETDIHLYQGWNLISLPVDTAVSPSLFGDDIIWKYSGKEWQLSAPHEETGGVAPPLNEIGSAEAVWVYTKREHTVSLNEKMGALHTFEDRDAMERYIERMVLNASIPSGYSRVREVDGVPVMENGTLSNTSAEDTVTKADQATDTNLQEAGVDESDILKHNGEYVFFHDQTQNRILIRTFSDIAAKVMHPVASIELPENSMVAGMFLHDDTLILITREQRYYIQQKRVTSALMPAPFGDDRFDIRMYDISDIGKITPYPVTSVEGNYIDSRIVEGKLYVVSQFHPAVRIEYPKVPVPDDLCERGTPVPMVMEKGRFVSECAGVFMENGGYFRYDYTRPTVRERHLIPTLDQGNGAEDLIYPDTFYAPYKLDQYPTIAVISKFGIDRHRFEGSVATMNGVNHLYVSGKNLYLTSANYPYYLDFRASLERETIYKFGIGTAFGYKARGTVEGGMLSQFSMSEKGDMLRVATTSGDGWRTETANRIFVLSEKRGELVEEGRLEGLGEEGERIRGVRFLDDKAYVVTFRQTDPFYVIDLSDPSAPQKEGELKINGFSRYLHPVNDRYLLTLGRDADMEGRTGGFMVQLYDVSDPASPKLSDIFRYSLSQYGFDAEYNPRAFVYRGSDTMFGITYREREASVMDIFRIDTAHGKIEQQERLELTAEGYERRGMLFDLEAETYGALFSAGEAASQRLRSEE